MDRKEALVSQTKKGREAEAVPGQAAWPTVKSGQSELYESACQVKATTNGARQARAPSYTCP